MTRYGYGRVAVDGKLWMCDAPSTGGQSRGSRHWIHRVSPQVRLTVSGSIGCSDWRRYLNYRPAAGRPREWRGRIRFAEDNTVEAVLRRAWTLDMNRIYRLEPDAGRTRRTP